MEKIEIISASKKGNLFCAYKFRQQIGTDAYNNGKMDSQRPIHEDLRNAFDALAIHLPVILGELPHTAIPDINSDITGQEITSEVRDLIKLFTVYGFEIEYDNKKPVAASITASKSLDLGSMGFTTPMIMYAGGYAFALELQIMIDRVVNEVLEYIDGKQADVVEAPDLFSSSDEGAQPGMDVAIKPKRGRPKKLKVEDSGELTELERANLGDEHTEPLSNYYVGGETEL